MSVTRIEDGSFLGETAPVLFENRAFPARLSQLTHDLCRSAGHYGFWLYSSWIETLLSYRSTRLGPLWMVIGTGVFVFAVGSLYGRVVLTGGTNAYIAHLAVGITFWYFIMQTTVGACDLFRKNIGDILEGNNGYTDLILKLISTRFIYFMHNWVIVIIALIVTGVVPSPVALLLVITLPLVLVNLIWIVVILSIVGARYPDVEELVRSLLRLLFFITPILWIPHEHVRGPTVDALLYLNPFYYFLEVIREPLVYGQAPLLEIAVLIAALPLGWLAASLLYARTKPWVALWV